MQFVEEVKPSAYLSEEVRNNLPGNLPAKDQSSENSKARDFQLLETSNAGVFENISSISQLEKFMSTRLGELLCVSQLVNKNFIEIDF